MTKKIVMGMGNAVLDVIFSCDQKTLDSLGLTKGQMTIVDQKKSFDTTKNLTPVMKSSGGSVANTISGIGILGGKASFCGRVCNDSLGKDFIRDIIKNNVDHLCTPSSEGPPTAKCSVFVTQDGERTMQTFLGASVMLDEKDIKEQYFKNTSILFIEGYLWSSESARGAIKKAISFAKKYNTLVVFSLSDSGLTKMFKNDFKLFIKNNVDLLIGNENEFKALVELDDLKEIAKEISLLVDRAVMTSGGGGAYFIFQSDIKNFKAHINNNIIDSTGAGDMFAAGFLYKLNLAEDIGSCIDFGCLIASKILSYYGARPTKEIFNLSD